MLADYRIVIGTIVFVAVTAGLLYKIVQLSRTLLRKKKKRTIVSPRNNGKHEPSGQKEEAPLPPWAGGVDAKTTVFVFPTIIVKDVSMVEHSYRLNFEDFHIGRSRDNQLVIPRQDVAPHHARIVLNDSGYAIEDLGTSSGTLVNGERITSKRPLNHMDKVVIGDTEIMFKVS